MNAELEIKRATSSDANVPQRYRLTISDYLLLDREGAFEAYQKTELIDGAVYAVSPQHRPHGFIKDELAYRVRRKLEAVGSPLHVATEQSVEIAPHSEPLPEFVLTSEPRGEGPIPVASVALVVEVSDSTLDYDLGEKLRIYAAAAISEYWVADVNARVIHQMWAPEGEAYAERRKVPFGEPVEAATIKGLAVETGGI